MKIVKSNKLFEDYFNDIEIEDNVVGNKDDIYNVNDVYMDVSDVNDWITFQFDVDTRYMTKETMFVGTNFPSRLESFLNQFEKTLTYILDAVGIVDDIHFKYTLRKGNINETDRFTQESYFNRTVNVVKTNTLDNYTFTISCYVRQGDIKTNKKKFIMFVNNLRKLDRFVRGKYAIELNEYVSVYMEYVKPESTWYELAQVKYKARLKVRHLQSVYGNVTAFRLNIIHAAQTLNCDVTYSDILRMTSQDNNDYDRLSEYIERLNPMKMFYCSHFEKLDFSRFSINDAFYEAKFLQCATSGYTMAPSVFDIDDSNIKDVVANRSGRMYIIDRPLLSRDAKNSRDVGKYRIMVIFDGTVNYSAGDDHGDEYILTLMSQPFELSDDYEKFFSDEYINTMSDESLCGVFQLALIAGHNSIDEAKKKMDKFIKLYDIK